ncbi:E3 ubiquitin-protein ligase PUB23-like [Phoenix dactylifera]|uniref:U-box domain-containing protein n=1 Tax=Phoenix dactylifera TaxID=42345 RepID=A0A8B7CCN5_PHODC|nr:E3 ubiquitin-protein ligase PUB23-like [Phoenix dactylifera]
MEEAPPLFRCPISMELMEDPVTISTGVTYERKNIEKWLFTYKKSTCPATMQCLRNLDLTPNHTLKRLITSWPLDHEARTPTEAPRPCPTNAIEHENLVSLLTSIESTPFKVSSLKKLRSIVEKRNEVRENFLESGGIQALGRIMFQVAADSTDFTTFRACEEALGVLSLLPLSNQASVELLLKPECMKPMMVMLQRGSAEARLHTMAILLKISKTNHCWAHTIGDQGMDVFKSLLELLSDEISTKLSSCSLDLLLEIVAASKKNPLKAIEAGAVCILIELLPDARQHNCEKILLLLKRLCECPEGRSAFADHGLGVAVVSKKILRVSELGTKLGVKILWLMCTSLPTEKVLHDMMVYGLVEKLLALLHIEGRSSTKEKAMKIIRLHGGAWRQYRCFPCELKDYLRLMNRS